MQILFIGYTSSKNQYTSEICPARLCKIIFDGCCGMVDERKIYQLAKSLKRN